MFILIKAFYQLTDVQFLGFQDQALSLMKVSPSKRFDFW